MGIENVIPLEMLSHIIGFLLVPEGRHVDLSDLRRARLAALRGNGNTRPEADLSDLRRRAPLAARRWNLNTRPDVDFSDLRNARLVCRRWNSVASTHTFRNVALLHTPAGNDFTRFKQLVANPTVQHAARCVEIYSGPHHYAHDLTTDRNHKKWGPWERSGKYKEFTSAIDCIADLPKLQAVHIRFSRKCTFNLAPAGVYWTLNSEGHSARLHTLEAVFKAIQTRATRGAENSDSPNTTITSLTIQNLQNIPIPGFVASELFGSVIKHINELRLLVVGHDTYDLTFEPWLQRSFLPLFANKLTSLHLAFNEHWGVAPGFFDGQGLFFPNLKTLTLGKFVIGHHNQFDWVLAQKSLETLRLDRCTIVSYLKFFEEETTNQNQLEIWNTRTHDWNRHPKWSFGLDDITFSFPGMWEAVFDGIHANLLNLVDFRMENPPWQGNSYFNSTEHMRCMLTCLRYITFDDMRWAAAEDFTGEMEFGNNDPGVLPLISRRNGYLYLRGRLNRAKETLAGDSRAFNALVRTVEARRRQRGLDPISA